MKPILALVLLAAALMGCQAAAAPAAEDMIERQRADLQAAAEELRAAAGVLSEGADAAFEGELAPPDMAAMPTPAPAATVAPTPTPAPTRPAGETGICYRTPEVQRWIIRRLGIQSCRLITEPELFRITDAFTDPVILKPGDLAGFANVPQVSIAGYCGDWTDADFVAGVLDGLNPDAAISVAADITATDGGNDPGAISNAIWGRMSAVEIQNGYGMTAAQAEGIYKRGVGLKQRINTRARDIADAVSTARDGKPGLIRLKTVGQAVVGNPPESGSVSVSVGVRWQPHTEMPEC